ncbi:MAG TPA: TrkA family potassium uptake protein [Clostridiales bacterium]|nr:TrkA family potassium uptake protein [Clostridiales bacterium]
MLQRKPIIDFGIIGLGRFGYALASKLAQANKEVLVLDSSEIKIKQIRNLTDNAFVVDSLNRETLEQAGIKNCGTVIVCIGENIEASILTTLNVIELGVPRVIAKAMSFEHGKVLEKIGAEVIYPEFDMAMRLAERLISSKVLEFIMLSNDMTISEV